MKKLYVLIAGVLLSLGIVTPAFSQSFGFWKFYQGGIRPIVNTYRVDATAGLSGTYLHAQDRLTASGTTILEGNVIFASITSCTSLQTTSTGQVICGSPIVLFGTGDVIAVGDTRYVKKSGDTMTGDLIVRANISGSSLTINGENTSYVLGRLGIGTAAPVTSSQLHLKGNDDVLRIEGSSLSGYIEFMEGSTARGYVGYGNGATFFTAGEINDGFAIMGSNALQLGANAKQIMTLSGSNVGIGTANKRIDTKLEVVGSVSGTVLHAENSITSSGTLLVDGLAYLNAYNCTGTNGGALTSVNGLITCTDDDAGSAFTSTGSLQNGFDRRYVKIQGDSMTGALAIKKISGTNTGNTLIVDTIGLVYSADLKNVGIGTESPGQILHLLKRTEDVAIRFEVPGTAAVAGAPTSAGPSDPGTAVDDATLGAITWSDPGNITSSDDTRATASFGSPDSSHYLKATNFGFAIPTGATIDGITVAWERRATGGTYLDNAVRIVKGGTIGATDKASGTTWPGTEATATYGSSSDLWGETWTATDINSSTFGAALSVSCGTMCAMGQPQVDNMKITVNYTASTPGVSATRWAMGMDYSDESKFKLSSTGAVGTNDVIAITRSGSVGIGTSSPDTKLEVIGTISGTILRGQRTVASSGSLIWEGSASGASLWVSTFDGAGLTDCDAATQNLAWDTTTKKFSCGTDSDTLYSAGKGLNLNVSNVFSMNASITGTSLEIYGTASGSIIHAQNELRSSGALIVEGNILSHANISGSTLAGAGLYDCDNATTSKILWDLTTKNFSCGTDTDTNTTYQAGQGLALVSGSFFRLNTTLTGSLIRFQTVSGSLVHADNQLRSSGSLIVEGYATFDTRTMFVNSDKDLVGIGTNNPLFRLDISSGSILSGTSQVRIINSLANPVSGTEVGLEFQSAGTAAAIDRTGRIYGKYDTNIYADARITIQSVQGGIYVDTLTSKNAKVGILTLNPETALEVIGTSSGQSLSAAGGSFTLSGLGAAVFNEMSQAIDFRIESNENANMLFLNGTTNRVGIGTSTPDTTLEVIGSMSGRSLVVTGTGARPTLFTDVTRSPNGTILLGATTQTGGFAQGKMYISRPNGQFGLYIAGESGQQADILLRSGAADPNRRIMQFVDNAGTFTMRSLTDALGVGFNMFSFSHTTGFVGINKKAPSKQLEVVGTISGSVLQVGGAPGGITRVLVGSKTIDFPSLTNSCGADTITVNGAVEGDIAMVGGDPGVTQTQVTAVVETANNVTVRACHSGAIAEDPASATFTVMVMKVTTSAP